MLESYVSALDQAMGELASKPLGRYEDLNFGGWVFGIDTKERALPPYMKNEPYTKYKVLVSFEVKSGEIVPWFDEVGGGTQYLSTYSVDELKKFGYIVEVE